MGAEWVGAAADRSLAGNGTSSARWRRISAQQALLLRLARRSAPSPQDAEDAVQEAMLRAAEHPDIDDDRLRAWLVTVTKRLCADRRRQQARETRHCARVAASTLTATTEQQLEDEVCHRAEAAWVAARADELLPARQAQALRLTAAGCDVQQVAGRLGVGPRAAESLLARARRTLRAVLAAGLGVLGWMCRPLGAASGSGPVALAAGASCVAAAVTVVLAPAPSPPQLGMASPPAGPTAADRQHARGATPVVETPPATVEPTTQQPVPAPVPPASDPAAAPARIAATTHTPPPAGPSRPPVASPAGPAVPLHAAVTGAVPGSAADARRAGPPGSPQPQQPPSGDPPAEPPAGGPSPSAPRAGPAESNAPTSPDGGPPAQRPSPGQPPPARSPDRTADPSSDPGGDQREHPAAGAAGTSMTLGLGVPRR
ncbi:MAG: sigma-70 family RNA polymerase sigma factor [Pseudonocardiaceae bacterium]|nr:sigma-70 family RNA polymerase sigma factor [Pseudonocardiaceae bacterium]